MRKNITISKYLPYFLLLVLLIVGSLLSKNFMQLNNISNILQYAAESGIIALGMTLVILTGGIDLSVGSTLAFSGVVSALLLVSGVSIAIVIVVSLLIGVTVGIINGIMITKAKVEPFMATLVMMMIMRALTLIVTGGGPVRGEISVGFRNIARSQLFGVPLPTIYLLSGVVVLYVVMNRTPFGRHIYAVGGSRETSILFGIKVNKIVNIVYVISSVFASFAGLLVTSRIGIGEPRSGFNIEMTAISMVIVGGASLSGGKGNIQGTFVGLLVISILMNLMNLLNIDSNMQPVIRGIIILITALFISKETVGSKTIVS